MAMKPPGASADKVLNCGMRGTGIWLSISWIPRGGGDVALAIFGENWPGNLVADGYGGYNPVNPASRQSCLAHLSRHAKEILQDIQLLPDKLKDRTAIAFCARLRNFLSDCCQLGQARNSGRITFSKARAHTPAHSA